MPAEPEVPIESTEPQQPPKKERDTVFDLAKGLGILFVLCIHCTGNSARLYTNSHSTPWWTLMVINRFAAFAVPLFLLISSVLYARSLATKPQVLPFYRRRLSGALWPYLVWSFIYFFARLAKEPAARKITTGKFLGIEIKGPALFVHVKERLLDLVWGKASFHLYFMVVLLALIVLLPPTVAYFKWRKPGFIEALITATLIQAGIFILQHNYFRLNYPASTMLWYVGSLIPGVWIGLNWEEYKARPFRYAALLGVLTLMSGYIYMKGELGALNGIPMDNYTSLGSQAAYTSLISILVLSLCFNLNRFSRILLPLGVTSLQIYLIHPLIIAALEKPVIVKTLNATQVGALLSPLLMFAITVGIIATLRLARLEKPLFGR